MQSKLWMKTCQLTIDGLLCVDVCLWWLLMKIMMAWCLCLRAGEFPDDQTFLRYEYWCILGKVWIIWKLASVAWGMDVGKANLRRGFLLVSFCSLAESYTAHIWKDGFIAGCSSMSRSIVEGWKKCLAYLVRRIRVGCGRYRGLVASFLGVVVSDDCWCYWCLWLSCSGRCGMHLSLFSASVLVIILIVWKVVVVVGDSGMLFSAL